jgi:hypothetical protein
MKKIHLLLMLFFLSGCEDSRKIEAMQKKIDLQEAQIVEENNLIDKQSETIKGYQINLENIEISASNLVKNQDLAFLQSCAGLWKYASFECTTENMNVAKSNLDKYANSPLKPITGGLLDFSRFWQICFLLFIWVSILVAGYFLFFLVNKMIGLTKNGKQKALLFSQMSEKVVSLESLIESSKHKADLEKQEIIQQAKYSLVANNKKYLAEINEKNNTIKNLETLSQELQEQIVLLEFAQKMK